MVINVGRVSACGTTRTNQETETTKENTVYARANQTIKKPESDAGARRIILKRGERTRRNTNQGQEAFSDSEDSRSTR